MIKLTSEKYGKQLKKCHRKNLTKARNLILSQIFVKCDINSKS